MSSPTFEIILEYHVLGMKSICSHCGKTLTQGCYSLGLMMTEGKKAKVCSFTDKEVFCCGSKRMVVLFFDSRDAAEKKGDAIGNAYEQDPKKAVKIFPIAFPHKKGKRIFYS